MDDNWKPIGDLAAAIVARLEDERREAQAILDRYAADAQQSTREAAE